jgi:hypothetical protein
MEFKKPIFFLEKIIDEKKKIFIKKREKKWIKFILKEKYLMIKRIKYKNF